MPFVRPRSGSRPAGFTLVEILVVMLILGLGLALVAVNLRESDRDRGLQEARRLAEALQHAALAAQWRAQPIAWSVAGGNAYRFLRPAKQETNGWQPVDDDTLLASHRLPAAMVLSDLMVAGQSAPELRIVFHANGINDTFSLRLQLAEANFALEGDALGRVEVKPR